MQGIKGCGLGLRREFLNDIRDDGFLPDWWEITPENWIYMPHHYRKKFEEALSLRPVVAHGLSLSIGSTDPLDKKFLKDLKTFFDRYNILHYSEHLSFSGLRGTQTYELLPLPMTKNMALHVSDRVKMVEDILSRPLILENATYYYVPQSSISEAEFINMVLEKSGAKMLLDVNNVYVNSLNHNFDASEFIKHIDLDKVAYIHVAGHYEDKELGLFIDTHGKEVKPEVWKLLKDTVGEREIPIMIERDNNIPPLSVMEEEYKKLEEIVKEVSYI